MNTSETISSFLEFLKECDRQYDAQYEFVGIKDKESQDLLHKLELQPLTYHQTARLASELRQVREDRREAKDQVAVLTPVMEYYRSNTTAIKTLERMLGEVRKAEKSLENRIYIPRVLKEVH